MITVAITVGSLAFIGIVLAIVCCWFVIIPLILGISEVTSALLFGPAFSRRVVPPIILIHYQLQHQSCWRLARKIENLPLTFILIRDFDFIFSSYILPLLADDHYLQEEIPVQTNDRRPTARIRTAPIVSCVG